MHILGCGYIGCALARRLIANQHPVIGVARSASSCAAITATGATACQLDLEHHPLAALHCADQLVFHSAPPSSHDDQDHLTARLVSHFLSTGNPRRVVYLSTTGVYGDCHGDWVDETWPVRPQVARAKRRADAEQRLRDWSSASGGELVILRVAGIYAADRLPLERLRSGLPVVAAAEAPWSNRIHADDLVTICLAAMERAPAGAIYNVCDNQPSTMTDYFCQVAAAVGLPAPPQIPLSAAPAHLSPGLLSYMQESRRLRNDKVLTELGVTLRYPTLADGLADLHPVT